MVLVLIILIALVCGVLGALVKGLLWLLFIGVILFVAGGIFGASKLRQGSSK